MNVGKKMAQYLRRLTLAPSDLHQRLIQCAKEGQHAEVKRLLRLKRLDPNFRDPRYGATALYYACQRGHTRVVALLLQYSNILVNDEVPIARANEARIFTDDYRFPSKVYLTPLHIACARGFLEIVQMLLNYPATDPNLVSNGMTPIHAAIRNGQLKVLSLLLYSADVNKPVGRGLTPLHYACELGSEDAVRLLLSHPKIDAAKLNKSGISPLVLAKHRGEARIVALLEEHLWGGEECAAQDPDRFVEMARRRRDREMELERQVRLIKEMEAQDRQAKEEQDASDEDADDDLFDKDSEDTLTNSRQATAPRQQPQQQHQQQQHSGNSARSNTKDPLSVF